MSPAGFMNVIQQVKNEAEKNHNDGFTVEKTMKWVVVIVALCCGVAFALILANAAGLHLFGGAAAPVQQVIVQNVTK
jgi:Na+(H+)/acetate symporter ActP